MVDLGPKLNTARLSAKKALPSELRPIYDELCATLMVGVQKHGSHDGAGLFAVLAEMVNLGWRRSAPPQDEDLPL